MDEHCLSVLGLGSHVLCGYSEGEPSRRGFAVRWSADNRVAVVLHKCVRVVDPRGRFNASSGQANGGSIGFIRPLQTALGSGCGVWRPPFQSQNKMTSKERSVARKRAWRAGIAFEEPNKESGDEAKSGEVRDQPSLPRASAIVGGQSVSVKLKCAVEPVEGPSTFNPYSIKIPTPTEQFGIDVIAAEWSPMGLTSTDGACGLLLLCADGNMYVAGNHPNPDERTLQTTVHLSKLRVPNALTMRRDAVFRYTNDTHPPDVSMRSTSWRAWRYVRSLADALPPSSHQGRIAGRGCEQGRILYYFCARHRHFSKLRWRNYG